MVATCENCGYAANLEKASSRLSEIQDGVGLEFPAEFPTPSVRTIEDLTKFPGGAAAEAQIKTLVYSSVNNTDSSKLLFSGDVSKEKFDESPKYYLVLLRGDHQLQETKLAEALAANYLRAASAAEIHALLGANPGSLGAVGAKKRAAERIPEVKIHIIADAGLKGRRNMTTGANTDDYHIRGVDIDRDIRVDQWADLRTVASGEVCPRCETGVLEVYKAMEIGHIFKLGTKYSKSMGATVLTPEGKEVPIVMGSYGIGVERIMTAAIEQNHDQDGIIWPKTLSPFDVVVTITNMKQDSLREAGEELYKELHRAGLEVLLDDRDERAGVKFKDADLIGIPYRITVGKKIVDGLVELFERRAKTTEDVKLSEIVSRIQKLALAGL